MIHSLNNIHRLLNFRKEQREKSGLRKLLQRVSIDSNDGLSKFLLLKFFCSSCVVVGAFTVGLDIIVLYIASYNTNCVY